MDERKQDELLYRVDERTESIDKNIAKLANRIEQNEHAIDHLEKEVNSNTQDLSIAKAMLGIVGTGLAGVLAKIVGVLNP